MVTTRPVKRQLAVPFNGKIADIQKADTNKYFLELANATGTGAIAGETRKIIAVMCGAVRITGTGDLRAFSNEGATSGSVFGWTFPIPTVIIKDGTQRLQYNQTVANDDWDLYCFGYFVEA